MYYKKIDTNASIRFEAYANRNSNCISYVDINPNFRSNFIEISQVFTDENFRGRNLATKLIVSAIKEALLLKKGIHLLIQPGSENFWRRFFNSHFNTHGISLFNYNGASLNSTIGAGKVIEITFTSLCKNYRFQTELSLRNKAIENIINSQCSLY